MDKIKLNEAHLISIVINENSDKSAVTIIDPMPDGQFKAIRIIRGKEAEALYDGLMASGEGPND